MFCSGGGRDDHNATPPGPYFGLFYPAVKSVYEQAIADFF
jgi:hypothetical protein